MIPNFDKSKSVTSETFCDPKDSDGSITCKIENPFFALKKCYPEKYFCIHQVVCPLNYRAHFQCSGLDLPKASNGKNGSCNILIVLYYFHIGKCIDSIFITSGILQDKQYCDDDCFPAFQEAGGSKIRIVLTSGLCCQKCGYSIWVNCVRQPSGSKSAFAKRDIDLTGHEVQTILILFQVLF